MPYKTGLGTLVIILLSCGAAHATTVGGIISTNTTWSDTSSPYTFSAPIQVAYGTTLTIDPGVQVSGGDIQVFGTLDVLGSGSTQPTLTGTTVALGATPNLANTGSIDINDAMINGGSIYAATGDAVYGTLSLTNSVLKGAGAMYIWYPTSNVLIQGNEFLNSGGISVGTAGNVTVSILNNYFSNWQPTYSGNAAIVNWASYGTSQTLVHGNTFANPGEVAVMLASGFANTALNATSNYWGTTDPATILAMVYDDHVDLSTSGPIPYEPYLTAASVDTPTPTPLPASLVQLVSGLVACGATVWTRNRSRQRPCAI